MYVNSPFPSSSLFPFIISHPFSLHNSSISTYYSEECRKWMQLNPGRVITIRQVGKLFGNAFMKAAFMETVVNEFRKTGIFPMDRNVTSCSGKELSKPKSSSQQATVAAFALSSKDIRSVLHCNRKTAKTKTTKKGKMVVLTESPYKNELIAEIEARKKKPVKRNLNLKHEVENRKENEKKANPQKAMLQKR
ncbi:hypothetical protein RN001_012836 [Aquatica leii]|uniref:Uncharacterized protein n=1 Tax=Aquatica leii TaxID=1421715 RepID=A0AAN7P3T6_9COLE|nr:hypothetical protein RN001_012836 [Aquatica leii]